MLLIRPKSLFEFLMLVQLWVPHADKNDEMSIVGASPQSGQLLSDLAELWGFHPNFVSRLNAVLLNAWIANVGSDHLEIDSLAEQVADIISLSKHLVLLGFCSGDYLDVGPQRNWWVDKEGWSDKAVVMEDSKSLVDPVVVQV